jgi:hypothetical protein
MNYGLTVRVRVVGRVSGVPAGAGVARIIQPRPSGSIKPSPKRVRKISASPSRIFSGESCPV